MSSPTAQQEMRDIRATVEMQLWRLTHLVADGNHVQDLTPGEARSLRAISTRLEDVVGALVKLAPR